MTTLEALAIAALFAPAGQDVRQTRAAAADARIHVESGSGSLRVVGWDRNEVSVTGDVCDGVVDMRGSDRTVSIEIGEDDPHHCVSNVEVKVPAGASLEIETLAASVSATGLTGTLRAESVNGGLKASGRFQLVELDSVAGNVELDGASSRVRAESVNGSVTLRGVTGEVEASTVTGLLSVSGASFRTLRLETVSGALRFSGSLDGAAVVTAESVSGAVDLELPAATDATFDARSFSGAVVNELSADRVEPSGRRYGPEQPELQFTLGRGSARVTVETVSGRIRLQRAGAR